MRDKTHGISFVIIITAIMFVFCESSCVKAPASGNLPEGPGPDPKRKPKPDTVSSATVPVTDLQKITLNGVKFLVNSNYQFFTWKELPSDVKYERMPVKEFTSLMVSPTIMKQFIIQSMEALTGIRPHIWPRMQAVISHALPVKRKIHLYSTL